MVDKNPYIDDEEQKEETLQTPGVIDKYKESGKIANSVLEKVIAKLVPGALIVEICEFGDNEIYAQLSKVYAKKKSMEKGIAFPTCISVNNICGHYSPLKSEAGDKDKEQNVLKDGDVAKIDLGVHIDGYIALVAHTVVVQADKNKPVEGRKADAILAAYKAQQVALRLLKPGNVNNNVTAVLGKTIESYDCRPLEGVLSHELKKHLIDGNSIIINKESFDQKAEDHEFAVNEVYALDIITSTGEGKAKETELRTTVYKRALEKNYTLKTKHGRTFYHDMVEKFPSLCFSCRTFDNEITTKLGIKECLEHDLLNSYPVLQEKPNEIVAHFKCTAMILQGGTTVITGLPFNEEQYKSDKKIEDAGILEILATSMDKKDQKKAKKKKNKEETQKE